MVICVILGEELDGEEWSGILGILRGWDPWDSVGNGGSPGMAGSSNDGFVMWRGDRSAAGS